MSDTHPATPLGSPPASVTGYGPDADALHAEVQADNAKDRLIAELREQYASLCCQFGPSPQFGQSARISLTVLNRHRKAAGLSPLPPSQHDRVPDALMRLSAAVDGEREIADTARRERDEARAQLADATAERNTLQAAYRAACEDRDRWHGMYDQAQAAHNAVAGRNAELAEQLATTQQPGTPEYDARTADLRGRGFGFEADARDRLAAERRAGHA